MATTRPLNYARLFAAGLMAATFTAPMAASAALNGTVAGVLGTFNPVVIQTSNSPERQAIMARAARLGAGITGPAISGLETVLDGFRIRFKNVDIYFSSSAGCHEVRSDIRD